jgi:hypothetical protein
MALQRVAGNRAVLGLVQRQAVWGAGGTVTENLNIAARAVRGETTLGYTPPTLNGNRLDDVSQARGKLLEPAIDQTQRGKTHVASVRSVPLNTGSFVMELPQRGTWTAASRLQQAFSVAGRYGVEAGIQRISELGDQTELAFRPDPDEATFLANVRTHEQRHADDHRDRFQTTVRDWDDRLTTAMNDRAEFHADSEDGARAELFHAVGGTADEVASSFFEGCDRASHDFHRTPAGAGPDGVSATVESTGWWPFRNPHGRVAITIRHP